MRTRKRRNAKARNATALRALRVQREARRGNSDVDLFLVVPPDATARAHAPNQLQTAGGDFPLGACNSYSPQGCSNGYASGDIFYLEVRVDGV